MLEKRYSLEKAQKEAEIIQKKVKSGEASNYAEAEQQLEQTESTTLDAVSVRTFFTEGLSEGYDFWDAVYERYESFLQNQSLNKTDRLLILDVFWSLASDFLKVPSDMKFPESLKEKLVADSLWTLQFIKYIQSWKIDMDEIVKWKEKMSPEEEKFFWQIFHRKFNIRSNRGFEGFPEPYRRLITEIIEARGDSNEPVSVLDIGCGPEAKAIRDLKKKYKDRINAFGINMEIYDKSLPGVSLEEGDIRSMPFDDGSIDFAYEIGVSGYFKTENDMAAFIRDVMRILKPGGKFLLTDARPNAKFLDSLGMRYEVLRQEPLLIVKR